MPRYMRAAKWYASDPPKDLQRSDAHFPPRKFEDAKKRIAKTMQWRREFKPDLIPPEEVLLWNQLFGVSLVLNDRDAGSSRERNGKDVSVVGCTVMYP